MGATTVPVPSVIVYDALQTNTKYQTPSCWFGILFGLGSVKEPGCKGFPFQQHLASFLWGWSCRRIHCVYILIIIY